MAGANNPCNVRRNAIDWQGEVAGDGAFADFDSVVDGVRAAGLCVLASFRHHACNTVRKIIYRFAPPADGNPSEAYARFVASQVGVGPDDPIDPENPEILQKILGAQSWWESHEVLSLEILKDAAQAALGL